LLSAYIQQDDPTGYIYKSGTPQNALAKIRDINYIDSPLTKIIDGRDRCLDLIPNILELKPDSLMVMITSQCTTEFDTKKIPSDF